MSVSQLKLQFENPPKFGKKRTFKNVQKPVDALFNILAEYANLEKTTNNLTD